MVQNVTPPASHTYPAGDSARVKPNRVELALAASLALDLASFHEVGHGQRTAYVAMCLADQAAVTAPIRTAAFYGALMHHVGLRFSGDGAGWRALPTTTPRASSAPDLCGWGNSDVLRAEAGALVAAKLGMPAVAIEAVAAVRERWDGEGAPRGLAGEEIPLAARLVTLADYLDSSTSGFANPLKARFLARDACRTASGTLADPALTELLENLIQQDNFWLGLYDARIVEILGNGKFRPSERSREASNVAAEFGLAFAHLVDARTGHGTGHSVNVAARARGFALALGYPAPTVDAIWFAGLWHDIGALAVPDKVLAKPDLLSVEEMDLVRAHPQHARQIFEAVPGLAPMAEWVGAHHERLDGKGYPDGLSGEEIPVEAQILAIADTYGALTSDRPYRRAMTSDEALRVMHSQTGLQFPGGMIDVFESLVG